MSLRRAHTAPPSVSSDAVSSPRKLNTVLTLGVAAADVNKLARRSKPVDAPLPDDILDIVMGNVNAGDLYKKTRDFAVHFAQPPYADWWVDESIKKQVAPITMTVHLNSLPDNVRFINDNDVADVKRLAGYERMASTLGEKLKEVVEKNLTRSLFVGLGVTSSLGRVHTGKSKKQLETSSTENPTSYLDYISFTCKIEWKQGVHLWLGVREQYEFERALVDSDVLRAFLFELMYPLPTSRGLKMTSTVDYRHFGPTHSKRWELSIRAYTDEGSMRDLLGRVDYEKAVPIVPESMSGYALRKLFSLAKKLVGRSET